MAKRCHPSVRPSVRHQGRRFPSQSRKAPEVSCERLASTVRMPRTLRSTVRGACRRGQGAASLPWAATSTESSRAWADRRVRGLGSSTQGAHMGIFPHCCRPCSLCWVGGQGWLSCALGKLQLAACSLPAPPQEMVPAAHSIRQHPLPQVPLPSLRGGGTAGVLLTLPCTAQYLLRPHVGLHPARMDGRAQDALVLQLHSHAPRHHVLGSLEEAPQCQHNSGHGWAREGDVSQPQNGCGGGKWDFALG